MHCNGHNAYEHERSCQDTFHCGFKMCLLWSNCQIWVWVSNWREVIQVEGGAKVLQGVSKVIERKNFNGWRAQIRMKKMCAMDFFNPVFYLRACFFALTPPPQKLQEIPPPSLLCSELTTTDSTGSSSMITTQAQATSNAKRNHLRSDARYGSQSLLHVRREYYVHTVSIPR